MASGSGAELRCFHQVMEVDPSWIELVDLPLDGWRMNDVNKITRRIVAIKREENLPERGIFRSLRCPK
jgi:hypothetical protein